MLNAVFNSLLGGVVGAIGICLMAKKLWSRQSFQFALLVNSIVTFSFFLMLHISSLGGQQAFSFRDGNDYSTDTNSTPQYPMDRLERRNVKLTSRELFKRPANSTFTADTESIILPLSVSDSKIVVRRYLTPVGVLFRYPVSSNDDGVAIEVFEFSLSENLSIYNPKVIIRLMPNGLGSSKIDIGSSSNLNRRDLV